MEEIPDEQKPKELQYMAGCLVMTVQLMAIEPGRGMKFDTIYPDKVHPADVFRAKRLYRHDFRIGDVVQRVYISDDHRLLLERIIEKTAAIEAMFAITKAMRDVGDEREKITLQTLANIVETIFSSK